MEKNNVVIDERFEKLHLLICILAAVSVTVACLVRGESLFAMALWVSLAIVLFYVLGNLVRYYLVTRVFPPPPPQEEEAIDEFEGETDAEVDTQTMMDKPNEKPVPLGTVSNRPVDYMSRE